MNKKILAVLAASLLCVSMTACGTKDTNVPTEATTAATTQATTQAPVTSIEGAWVAKTAVTEGITMDLVAIGMHMEFNFKDNGKVEVTTNEEGVNTTEEGTWTKTAEGATITDGTTTFNLVLKDGKLEMSDNSGTFIFEKK